MTSKIQNILAGNNFTAIEVFTKGGEDGLAIVRIAKKRNELYITDSVVTNQSTTLQEKISKNDCTLLVINDSQVLQKEVTAIDKDDIKIINKAFPNFKDEEFYYEIYRMTTKSIVAVCRKNYAEQLLLEYNNAGISFSGISLGICSLSQIAGFIVDNNTLNTNSQSISFDNQEFTFLPSYDNQDKSYQINGLQIESTFLLGFSALLKVILRSVKTTGNITERNEILWDNHSQKKLFTSVFKVSVYSILVILLFNFFAFNHYYNLATNTAIDLKTSTAMINDISSLRTKVSKKEDNFNTLYYQPVSKSSFIINKLIHDLPSSVILDKLIYHPLDKAVKEGTTITTEYNTIIISGKSVNNSAFTSWVEILQNEKEIMDVTTTSFGKNESNETLFTLKLLTNETE